MLFQGPPKEEKEIGVGESFHIFDGVLDEELWPEQLRRSPTMPRSSEKCST